MYPASCTRAQWSYGQKAAVPGLCALRGEPLLRCDSKGEHHGRTSHRPCRLRAWGRCLSCLAVGLVAVDDELRISAAAQFVQVHADPLAVGVYAERKHSVEQPEEQVDQRQHDAQ